MHVAGDTVAVPQSPRAQSLPPSLDAIDARNSRRTE